jgi:hypothetical protein
MKRLLTAGYVCALVPLIFLPPAFGLAAVLIGVIVLARGRVGHGIAIVVLAVTCGYVGMYFGDFVWRSFVTPRPYNSQPSDTAPLVPLAQTPLPQDWHVVSIETRVIESNDLESRYAWKVTIQNDSSDASGFQGEIEFLDADGFPVDRSPAYDHSRADTAYTMLDGFKRLNQARLMVPAKSQAEFTGIAIVRAAIAAKVARTEAKIHKEAENERPAGE